LINRKDTGTQGEIIAQNYLKKHGYHIIENNYRSRFGEIDIIAKHNDTLVFIEVRTKKNMSFGIPEESITNTKARHLIHTAYYYRQNHKNLPDSWRIDFLAIDLDENDKPLRINLIENAIEGD
jgi:putative endonuclease